MSAQQPAYWLAYVSDERHRRGNEITAIGIDTVAHDRYAMNTQRLLTVVDAYHLQHQAERVIFAAAVTRWLDTQGYRWDSGGVDFWAALDDLDAHAPLLLIQTSELVMGIVGNAARQLVIQSTDGGGALDVPAITEEVRAALFDALQRDWPDSIRDVILRSRGASAGNSSI